VSHNLSLRQRDFPLSIQRPTGQVQLGTIGTFGPGCTGAARLSPMKEAFGLRRWDSYAQLQKTQRKFTAMALEEPSMMTT